MLKITLRLEFREQFFIQPKFKLIKVKINFTLSNTQLCFRDLMTEENPKFDNLAF